MGNWTSKSCGGFLLPCAQRRNITLLKYPLLKHWHARQARHNLAVSEVIPDRRIPRINPGDSAVSRRIRTRCCVVGGGPAGIVLGFLLWSSRRGFPMPRPVSLLAHRSRPRSLQSVPLLRSAFSGGRIAARALLHEIQKVPLRHENHNLQRVGRCVKSAIAAE